MGRFPSSSFGRTSWFTRAAAPRRPPTGGTRPGWWKSPGLTIAPRACRLPTTPPWTAACRPLASPLETHALHLLAYRVGARSGALTTAGSRTVNVEPRPQTLSTVQVAAHRPAEVAADGRRRLL